MRARAPCWASTRGHGRACRRSILLMGSSSSARLPATARLAMFETSRGLGPAKNARVLDLSRAALGRRAFAEPDLTFGEGLGTEGFEGSAARAGAQKPLSGFVGSSDNAP